MPNRGTIRARRLALRVSLLVLVAFGAGRVGAAMFAADAVKAAYLFRFAAYVEWPVGMSAPAGPFVIAVAGADDVAGRLDELLPRMSVRGRPAQVRRISQPKELEGVHVLYVGTDSLGRTRALRRAALERPILIVTDDPQGLDAGGIINFLVRDRNVRFEISLIAADRAGLKIDSALLAVAAHVERRPQTRDGCRGPDCGSIQLARVMP